MWCLWPVIYGKMIQHILCETVKANAAPSGYPCDTVSIWDAVVQLAPHNQDRSAGGHKGPAQTVCHCSQKTLAQQLWLVLRGRHHQKSGTAVALPQQRVVYVVLGLLVYHPRTGSLSLSSTIGKTWLLGLYRSRVHWVSFYKQETTLFSGIQQHIVKMFAFHSFFFPAIFTPAFSTPALWCRVFHSRVFHSREFSVPHVATRPHRVI